MLRNVEAERGRLQLTKTKLCEKLGITTKTYNGYLSGTAIPSDVLINMSSLFDCRVDYLLGLSDRRQDRTA